MSSNNNLKSAKVISKSHIIAATNSSTVTELQIAMITHRVIHRSDICPRPHRINKTLRFKKELKRWV